MIRITMTEDGTSVLLRVEGRIVDEWVDLLDDTCREVGDNGIGLILDLSGVTFASFAGLSVLRRLRARGVTFHDCPTYLKDLCDEC